MISRTRGWQRAENSPRPGGHPAARRGGRGYNRQNSLAGQMHRDFTAGKFTGDQTATLLCCPFSPYHDEQRARNRQAIVQQAGERQQPIRPQHPAAGRAVGGGEPGRRTTTGAPQPADAARERQRRSRPAPSSRAVPPCRSGAGSCISWSMPVYSHMPAGTVTTQWPPGSKASWRECSTCSSASRHSGERWSRVRYRVARLSRARNLRAWPDRTGWPARLPRWPNWLCNRETHRRVAAHQHQTRAVQQ